MGHAIWLMDCWGLREVGRSKHFSGALWNVGTDIDLTQSLLTSDPNSLQPYQSLTWGQ